MNRLNLNLVFLVLSGFSLASSAKAQVAIVATVPDLAALARRVGGPEVSVECLAKGTQDPHFIEAKPSFMTRVSNANLVLSMGLELEIGWLPPILKGARNPKVQAGSSGFLEFGPSLEPLELPSGKVSRSDGDVHPDGNPHFNLDPVRVGKAAKILAERLSQLDPAHGSDYKRRAQEYEDLLNRKTREWQSRIDRSGVKKVVTYHKTLTYFLDRFKIANTAILEPKPGIPPTAGHTLEVIETMRRDQVNLVLVENYFDQNAANRIRDALPAVRVVSVPVQVEGAAGVKSTEDLVESLVKAIEGK